MHSDVEYILQNYDEFYKALKVGEEVQIYNLNNEKKLPNYIPRYGIWTAITQLADCIRLRIVTECDDVYIMVIKKKGIRLYDLTTAHIFGEHHEYPCFPITQGIFNSK